MMRNALLLSALVTAIALTSCQGSNAHSPGYVLQQQILQTKSFFKNLASQHLFAGSFSIHYKDKGFVFEEAYGLAIPQLGVRLQRSHSLQIGSNTKLFTAVSLWQLHERGLIDMHVPVNRYMDKADFNQDSDWCPRLRNSTECSWPTAAQLLMMSSGMIDSDNCVYPDGAWQTEYCKDLDQIPNLIDHSPVTGGVGGPTPAQYFSAWGCWDNPLQSLPGTGYMYVNANFILGAYLVEKLSGLRFGNYLRQHILQPAGLLDTHYDISTGYNSIATGLVQQPAYRAIFGPVSADYVDDINRTTSVDAARIAATPPGSLAQLYALPYASPGLAAALSGAGALHSTPRNMAYWYRTLLFQPSRLNLSQETVIKMVTLRNENYDNHGMYFGQGLLVKPDASMKPYGVEAVFYEGGLDSVSSPVLLKFMNCSAACGERDAVTVTGIVTMTPELQVPLNRSTCEVPNVWAPSVNGSVPLAKLPKDVCEVFASSTLSNPLPTYVMGKLVATWGLGVRNEDPAGPPVDPWVYLAGWLGMH